MERRRASDFPQGLLDLFDRYVHGEISRRQFLEGAAKYAVDGLTAMAIWESLRPNYALAEQIPPHDERLKTEYVNVPSPQGNGSIRGYFVRPANAQEKLPGVLVLHSMAGNRLPWMLAKSRPPSCFTTQHWIRVSPGVGRPTRKP
jgi:carboxymethylenebutenolidase